MYFEETKKLDGLFNIAIAVVLIAGLIAGIVCGMGLRVPTEEAREALTELTTSDYIRYEKEQELIKISQEVEWTGTGVGIMLGTWVMSAVTALLLCAKNREIIMLDMIAGSINGLSEEDTTEQETAAE